jgi:hypothetical protein
VVKERAVGAAVAVFVLAGLLSACGGGGSSAPEQQGSVVSKAAFVKKADELCKAANGRRDLLIETALKEIPPNKQVSAKEREELVARFLPPVEKLSEEFAGLQAPEREEAEVEKVAAALQESVFRSQSEPASAVNGSAFQEFDNLSARYGLRACHI